MLRVIIGAAVAAVAMLLLSFLVHMTPLAGAGYGNVGTQEAAQVQSSLALNLRETGTYRVPDPNTAEQTGLYAQGPVATIIYNVTGEAGSNMGSLRFAYALFLNFLIALAIGALGFALLPYNPGSQSYVIYACAFFPFCMGTRKALLAIVALLAAYAGMMRLAVRGDGFLGWVQPTGAAPCSGPEPLGADVVPNFEDFGVGCFLLAGSEVLRLGRGAPVSEL